MKLTQKESAIIRLRYGIALNMEIDGLLDTTMTYEKIGKLVGLGFYSCES